MKSSSKTGYSGADHTRAFLWKMRTYKRGNEQKHTEKAEISLAHLLTLPRSGFRKHQKTSENKFMGGTEYLTPDSLAASKLRHFY